MQVDLKRVARDAVVVFALTFIGGFLVGIAGQFTYLSSVWIGVSNLVLGSAGFAYSAYNARGHRWEHLFAVALGVWLLSLINPLLGLSSISSWTFGIIFILILMLIGAGIGFRLRSLRKHP